MTYDESIKQGYRECDWALFRGYVSRKNYNKSSQTVKKAGGSRKDYLYITSPNWESTQYSYRIYLKKD